jgi:hypothetical protein
MNHRKSTQTPPPAPERPALVSVRETQRQLGGICRATLYLLLKHHQLRSVTLKGPGIQRGRRMILQESIDAYVAVLTREAEAHEFADASEAASSCVL